LKAEREREREREREEREREWVSDWMHWEYVEWDAALDSRNYFYIFVVFSSDFNIGFKSNVFSLSESGLVLKKLIDNTLYGI